MTAKLFEDVLREWNERLGQQGRIVLLCLDNFSGHPPELQLENIQLLFFPPNTTSNSQPMDQGIIENLKRHYKKFCCVVGSRPWTWERSSSSHCSILYSLSGVIGSRSASLRLETASQRLSLAKRSINQEMMLNCWRSGKLFLPRKGYTRTKRSSCLTFLKRMSASRREDLSHWRTLRRRC